MSSPHPPLPPPLYIGGGLYPYTAHLLEFSRRVSRVPVPAWLRAVDTPLVHQQWTIVLAAHPDREFATYILQGIEQGFGIGFDHAQKSCRPAMSNMLSATEQAEVVQAYLDKEVALGRVVGPVSLQAAPANTQISPFGVIPKSSQPGKWRLILDLSSPEGCSVNSGIEPELCSLQYLRMDDVVQRIAALGRGTQLAKMDIESAYRIVPVQPGDRPCWGCGVRERSCLTPASPSAFGLLRRFSRPWQMLFSGLFRYRGCPGWHITWMILSRWGLQVAKNVGGIWIRS